MALEKLDVIEGRLSPYYLGARFSFLDLAVTYWVTCLDLFGQDETFLAAYPKLRRCAELVKERPKLKPRFDAMPAEFEAYLKRSQPDKGQ